jgi:molecular chaperone GrpE
MSNEETLEKNQMNMQDDLQSDEVLDAVAETAAEAFSPEELIERLDQAEKKAMDNWDQLLRTKAEMDNIRRRTQKDLENAHKFALEKFITELLGVKDSLEMGVNASQQDNATVEILREGSEMTLSILSGLFEKFNVVELNPQGEKFNPDHHQAMSMQPSAEHEPNTVMAVMQKGYLLNDRLVRPAMVMVSKAAD